MATKNNKKIINSSDDGSVTSKPGRKAGRSAAEQTTTDKRKRGRPKGTTNKTIRKDHDINAAEPGRNAYMIKYAMAFSDLPDIDINNPVQVSERIKDMFNISAAFDIKPSIAALAMAFHIDRVTLFNYMNGRTSTLKNSESFNAIKNAYSQINLLYETYMNTGTINPVAGIFLMKNNMGYKDTTDFVVTANQDNTLSLSDIAGRANLLSE